MDPEITDKPGARPGWVRKLRTHPGRAPEGSVNYGRRRDAPRTHPVILKVVFRALFGHPVWGRKNNFRMGKRSTGAFSTFLHLIGLRSVSWAPLGPNLAPETPGIIIGMAPQGRVSLPKGPPGHPWLDFVGFGIDFC